MMIPTIAGGLLIGVATGALFLFEGRIAGVSGMLKGALAPRQADSARPLRIMFLIGLIAGGAIVEAIAPGTLPARYSGSVARIFAAGLLVGVGAGYANGCTSGHGLCGVARGSARSLVASVTFTAVAMLTLVGARTLLGG